MRTHHLKTLAFIAILFLPVVQPICTEPARSGFQAEIDPVVNPWTNLHFERDPNDFAFAVVADRAGGRRPGIFGQAVERLNLLRPEFVMCVGDLIDGASQEVAELDQQWDEFDGLVHRLNRPFFYTVGNHDIKDVTMEAVWAKRLGRKYYSFTYQDVLFLVLCSQDPPGRTIGDEQIEHFREVLAQNKDTRWTFVFLHHPLWTYDQATGWKQIEELLADRPYTVFAGHTHTYEESIREGRKFYILGTTGGGSGLRGPDYGEFDHFLWVDMEKKGPEIGNILLDGIRLEQ